MPIFLRLCLSAIITLLAIAVLYFSGAIGNLAATTVVLFLGLLLSSFISPNLAKIKLNLPTASSNKTQGSVKWFNPNKGFGFITQDNGQDVFVHFRSIQGKGRKILKEGQRVSFRLVEEDKGPQAEDVELI